MDYGQCAKCGKVRDEESFFQFKLVKGDIVCTSCYADYVEELTRVKAELEKNIQAIILTTTNNIAAA